jgi:hypothetical protein
MPVPAHEHQRRLRAWIGLDRVQKDLREYFYREKVGFVTRLQLMGSVIMQEIVVSAMEIAFEGGGRNDGGYVGGSRVNVEQVEIRRIEVRIHGE